MLYKTIVDRIHEPSSLEAVRRQIEAAHKFVFSPAASRLIAEIADNTNDDPELIGSLIREPLPFPSTYIEYDMPDEDSDARGFVMRCGNAFVDNHIYSIVADDDGSPMLMPLTMIRTSAPEYQEPKPMLTSSEIAAAFRSKSPEGLLSLSSMTEAANLFAGAGVRYLDSRTISTRSSVICASTIRWFPAPA